MQKFDIHFSGRLLENASPEAAKAAIGKLFKLQGEALERLFSGSPVRIKKDVDAEKAGRYRAAFREAGALIEVVPAGAPPSVPAPASAQDAGAKTAAKEEQGLQLLPPGTGSLQDCAVPVTPRAIPDISWMELDLPGALLDEKPVTPPAHIDTSSLSMSAPAGYSLEDCGDTKQARPIPDTDHLSLLEK